MEAKVSTQALACDIVRILGTRATVIRRGTVVAGEVEDTESKSEANLNQNLNQ